MADLLPSSPDTSAVEDANPRVVGVDSEDADDLIAALSSETARALLAALHDDPANPAKLADTVDTTIQNAQYHLEKLEDAGLIEVVDTVYSEKGREMKVYAPSDRPLVVVAGRAEETSGLKTALSRLLGAVAALAVGSAVVQQLLAGDLLALGGPGDGREPPGVASGPTETKEAADVAANATATGTPTPAATGTPTPRTAAELGERTATEVPTLAAGTSSGVEPGLLFFAGGLAVLLAAFAVRHWRR
jgi:DNA-binding transcriptional ArsR family regulator